MPTPSALAKKLNRFVFSSLEKNNALAIKTHNVTQLNGGISLVSWSNTQNPDLSNLSIEDIRTYIFFLEEEHYSMICKDGSLVQISFKIKRGNIVGHRLCFIPCPVEIDEMQLQDTSLSEIVKQNIFSSNFDLLKQRGTIRFDYDPDSQAENHPAAHATVNYDQSRIPVARIFDACSFLEFIDMAFLARSDELRLGSLPISRDTNDYVLSEENILKPHISWNLP